MVVLTRTVVMARGMDRTEILQESWQLTPWDLLVGWMGRVGKEQV